MAPNALGLCFVKAPNSIFWFVQSYAHPFLVPRTSLASACKTKPSPSSVVPYIRFCEFVSPWTMSFDFVQVRSAVWLLHVFCKCTNDKMICVHARLGSAYSVVKIHPIRDRPTIQLIRKSVCQHRATAAIFFRSYMDRPVALSRQRS